MSYLCTGIIASEYYSLLKRKENLLLYAYLYKYIWFITLDNIKKKLYISNGKVSNHIGDVTPAN